MLLFKLILPLLIGLPKTLSFSANVILIYFSSIKIYAWFLDTPSDFITISCLVLLPIVVNDELIMNIIVLLKYATNVLLKFGKTRCEETSLRELENDDEKYDYLCCFYSY